jgi:adenine deaminase
VDPLKLKMEYTIGGNIVDVINRKIYPGEILVKGKRIKKITTTKKTYHIFIIPGLIDAHVHIESSMLVPSEFSRLAVKHGTVATVSDPHEIANVLGTEGNSCIRMGEKYPLNSILGCRHLYQLLILKHQEVNLTYKRLKNCF